MKLLKSILAATAILVSHGVGAQTPVDPSTFPGHYFTEEKMQIDGKKKKDEVDFTFDAATGRLVGTVKGFEDKTDKIVLRAEDPYKSWAANTKIWILRNNVVNRMGYGREMFDEGEFVAAVFIEDGVLVMFKYYGGNDKKVRMFDVVMKENNIRIIAKDKSKFSINKLEAAKRAEDLINAAGGVQMKKMLDDQNKAAFGVPNESLSKTDKELKKDILDFFNNLAMPPGDQTDFICAYSTSNDWTIINNNLTGAILGRELNIEMIRKGRESGKCRRYPYKVYEAYNGSGFGKPAFRSKYDMVECDCSQVDKNK